MIEFFKSFFRPQASGATAKERLRLVLLSDHLSLAPDVIEALKADLLDVIRKYVVIDEQHADVTFEHREHEIAMLANVPILSINGGRPAPAPSHVPPPATTVLTVSAEATPVAGPETANAAAPDVRPRRRRRRKRSGENQPALGQVSLQA